MLNETLSQRRIMIRNDVYQLVVLVKIGYNTAFRDMR